VSLQRLIIKAEALANALPPPLSAAERVALALLALLARVARRAIGRWRWPAYQGIRRGSARVAFYRGRLIHRWQARLWPANRRKIVGGRQQINSRAGGTPG
jgi:hypothetical protein